MERNAPFRAARAALFAALCVTLSTTSHVLLSRQPLPLATVAFAFLGMFTLAYALAGRERGFWPITALLVPLELAADTVFTTGQHTCYGPSGGPVTGALRSFGADVICDGGRVGTPLAGAVPVADPAVPWLLLAAHVTVGLLASWWLRRGEAALHQLLRATASFAFRPLARAAAVLCGHLAVPQRPRAHRPEARSAVPTSPLLLHSVPRRGPPRPVAA
jgi:hypothetical protein